MAEEYTALDVHPVMTMAGIMPGGSEMKTWYSHVPFTTPAQLELKREELLEEIEAWKAEKALNRAARGLAEVFPAAMDPANNAA